MHLISDEEPEDIQNTIYQIAKSNGVQPKDFFKISISNNFGHIYVDQKLDHSFQILEEKKSAKTISEYI